MTARENILFDIAGHPRQSPTITELEHTNPSLDRDVLLTIIHELQDDGLVTKTTTTVDGHTAYSLTSAGREVLTFSVEVYSRQYDRVQKPDEVKKLEQIPRRDDVNDDAAMEVVEERISDIEDESKQYSTEEAAEQLGVDLDDAMGADDTLTIDELEADAKREITRTINVITCNRDSIKTAFIIASENGATVADIAEYVDTSELHDHLRRMQDAGLIHRDTSSTGRPTYTIPNKQWRDLIRGATSIYPGLEDRLRLASRCATQILGEIDLDTRQFVAEMAAELTDTDLDTAVRDDYRIITRIGGTCTVREIGDPEPISCDNANDSLSSVFDPDDYSADDWVALPDPDQ